MPKAKKLPLVAICGRPNVGKSTLFNRLIGKSRAIVHDEEGITRDRFFGNARWGDHQFRIVDTGGIVENPEDNVTLQMQAQVDAALNEARVIIFVVDGQQPLTRVDREVRDRLYKYSKPVLLAVNKLDNDNLVEQHQYDFFELGLGDPFPISSGHGLGIDALREAIVSHLPPPAAEAREDGDETADSDGDEDSEAGETPETDPRIKVAIVGKPNVGKSSFVNAILNEQRNIVDSVPGTTRDAIDVDFTWNDQEYVLIDTAGLRKKAGITRKVEQFSVSRSLRAVRRADVCLIMIDATEGMSEQDKRIIGYCRENGTAMILVWTKWDLIEDKARRFKAIGEELNLKMAQIHYVPYITISNVTRQRLFSVFEHIDRIYAESRKRIPTAEMNRFIDELKVLHKPPSQKGKHAKILYGTQASVKPTTVVLFVNQARLFHFSYLRFVENQLRQRFGFEGVPIHLELREGKPRA
ncbi:MAG: ribosome biogenesis GTPase Der [Candidatus Hydrogenedentes bacterium]|nr:ribosome biogenesis GTPase Der [Candidatus Hydrogenedentota bacterium]